jgi:neutral ceramidase
VDAFDSTRIIAQNQVNKAVELLTSAKTELSGPVAFAHMYVDMEHVQVSKQFTSTGEDETTCTGALGDAFAGGTTDGPGDFDFTQGTNSTSTNPVWNMLAHFLKEPSTSDVACHHPKPILFLSGGINLPSTWTPSIIPLQIFRIGQLWIIGAPGEFTTMSGRRLRDTVRNALIAEGVADENSYIIIAGLSNEYTHYITTYEEYQIQRYEGGSTLFGPHTLAAYQQEFTRLAQAIARNQTPDSHAPPVDISSKVFNFQTPVVVDAGSFGAIQSGPKAGQVFHANDVVTVVFHGANPRNAFDDPFCDVEQLVNSQWKVVLNDGDIDTKYRWQRTGGILSPTSLSTCEWTIAADAPKGTYRIHHHGTKKSLLGKLSKFDGVSEAFTVA